MSGYVGLLFREFAVAVSVALVLSLLISLTLTPMMCAYLLKPESKEQDGCIGSSSAASTACSTRMRQA